MKVDPTDRGSPSGSMCCCTCDAMCVCDHTYLVVIKLIIFVNTIINLSKFDLAETIQFAYHKTHAQLNVRISTTLYRQLRSVTDTLE